MQCDFTEYPRKVCSMGIIEKNKPDTILACKYNDNCKKFVINCNY